MEKRFPCNVLSAVATREKQISAAEKFVEEGANCGWAGLLYSDDEKITI